MPGLAAGAPAARQGALPQSISGISIDSRTMTPGEAFFAIAGDNRDGHQFVTAALAVVSARGRGKVPFMAATGIAAVDVLLFVADVDALA